MLISIDMKKAVILTGGKQYIVSKGDVIDIESLARELGDKKTIEFNPLLITDGKETQVGTPEVAGVSVKAKIVEQVRADKVTAIRYKAKKRVHKRHGHKQHMSRIEITSIA